MTPVASQADRTRARALAAVALRRPQAPIDAIPDRLLVVDVDQQQLYLLDDAEAVACYPVSTSARGIGGEEGSFRTPEGWHRIHSKVGDGAPEGAVFESRRATGEVWRGNAVDADLILTRVLVLEGLEDGVNRGAGVDSLARYIYLHGTNHLGRLGTPASHGCVRMANGDVIELFDRVEVGDHVAIVACGARRA